jgi:hypothetical protein
VIVNRKEEDFMSRTTAALLASALALSAGALVSAQAKVIPGEHRTTSATVEAIDTSGRLVTLRMPQGELRTIRLPEEAKRLSEIKPGDTVKATYYDNIVIRVKPASEPAVDQLTTAKLTPGSGARPGGTSASQQTITATIDAIDLKVPSISFKGPREWSYSTKVQDVNALKQVKVGDRVDITWTEATLVAVNPVK